MESADARAEASVGSLNGRAVLAAFVPKGTAAAGPGDGTEQHFSSLVSFP